MRFDSKVFLVTGGSHGIGRAIVQRLVAEGARVCIVDTDARGGREVKDACGDRARFERGDVSREADVRRCVAATVRWAGRLDGVINNAAIANPHVAPTERLSLATWRRYIDVNLGGTFLVTKHAIAHLRRARGAIINLGSTRAFQSEPNTIAYAAAKGGVVALTHALAISLGPRIRVNCVCPGWIATGAQKLSKRDHAQHPVGRVGVPDDVAGLCAWLLSAEAGFVTGASFTIDGGMTRKMIYA
jgi:NAD(P)-dependent dehydrogenase (short-subunit alcohol dehydrogenase family)